MKLRRLVQIWWAMMLVPTLTGMPSADAQPRRLTNELVDSLTFYASFDGTVEADVARGDPRLYTIVAARPQDVVKAGLETSAKTVIAPGAGLQGDALRFTARDAPRLFYQADRNLVYQRRNWQGTVSLWLRLDPERDLEPGYCDPIQITPRKWNDAAFFVDFDKAGAPRDFRLGAFADQAVWNPENKPPAEIPESERPLLPVKNPPFGPEKWTHVAFSWLGFNSGGNSGQASFYLDGKLQGRLSGWNQQFTWSKDEQSRIYIGINYIGLFDELACFDRALGDQEMAALFRLRGGLKALVR